MHEKICNFNIIVIIIRPEANDTEGMENKFAKTLYAKLMWANRHSWFIFNPIQMKKKNLSFGIPQSPHMYRFLFLYLTRNNAGDGLVAKKCACVYEIQDSFCSLDEGNALYIIVKFMTHDERQLIKRSKSKNQEM